MSVKFLSNLCGVEVTKNKFHVVCKLYVSVKLQYLCSTETLTFRERYEDW